MHYASLSSPRVGKRLVALLTLATASYFTLMPQGEQITVQAEVAVSTVPKAPSSGSLNQTSQQQNSCADCHEKVVLGFAKTVHGKVQKWKGKVNANPSAESLMAQCATCHGDGAAHMADPGDMSLIKTPTKLKPAEATETCMQCHLQMKEHAVWRGSKHETAGLSCVSCHSMHHTPVSQMNDSKLFTSVKTEAKLLKAPTEADTCFKCHADIRKAQFQRSTHLFRNENREHQIQCSSCHEPHGSIGEKMMRTAQVNETCYQCHTEKRGPFLFEHSPTRESCSTCHRAHGSNNIALLNARVPMLCQQCHIQGRHQTVAGRPNSAFTINRACLTCHSQIHGSNHPSGINLQR